MTRKNSSEMQAWARTIAFPAALIIFTALGFYFQQKYSNEKFEQTLGKHEAQFKEVSATFEKFNETQKKNYTDWAAANQKEVEKQEARAKEERETREKMRDTFMALFQQLSNSSVSTSAEVKSISKVLDGLSSKIENIQNVQQQRANQAPRTPQ